MKKNKNFYFVTTGIFTSYQLQIGTAIGPLLFVRTMLHKFAPDSKLHHKNFFIIFKDDTKLRYTVMVELDSSCFSFLEKNIHLMPL